MHYFLLFDFMAATIESSSSSTATAFTGSKIPCSPQASSPHPGTADTQKTELLHCARIDFVELEHLWETESTTRIKMIWLTLQFYLLLRGPFFSSLDYWFRAYTNLNVTTRHAVLRDKAKKEIFTFNKEGKIVLLWAHKRREHVTDLSSPLL